MAPGRALCAFALLVACASAVQSEMSAEVEMFAEEENAVIGERLDRGCLKRDGTTAGLDQPAGRKVFAHCVPWGSAAQHSSE